MKRFMFVLAVALGMTGCEIQTHPDHHTERPYVVVQDPAPSTSSYATSKPTIVTVSEPTYYTEVIVIDEYALYTYYNKYNEYCYSEWDEWGECIVDYCWDEWYDVWYVYMVDCIF